MKGKNINVFSYICIVETRANNGDSSALIVGILLIIIWGIIKLIPLVIPSDKFFEYSIPLRILIAIWAYNIAKRQNRQRESWALLAFLLPAISLIILGWRRKV
jgi:hypothetical protein